MSYSATPSPDPPPSHSEASKMLEAALEQMDGIIQGAKFDFPGFIDPHHTHNSANGNGNHISTASLSVGGGTTLPKKPDVGVALALKKLKLAILQEHAQGKDVISEKRDDFDPETLSFLARWIRSQPGTQEELDNDNRSLTEVEERLLSSETEKDSLKLTVGMLQDQMDSMNLRLMETERLLSAKKELLRKTEQTLDRERLAKTTYEGNPSGSRLEHLSELSHFKAKCNSLESENVELRKLVGGNRTPKYLPISPRNATRNAYVGGFNNGDSSSPSEDLSPVHPGKKEVGFTGRDEDIPVNNQNNVVIETDLDASFSTTNGGTNSRRSGFKKIFGKIKRSNSGGQLEDENGKNSSSTKRSGTPEFKRGGFRATTSGRLTGWGDNKHKAASTSRLSEEQRRRPLQDWNTDTITTWMECLGLGSYTGELVKNVGNGEQLAKMTPGELETKLGLKNPLHRKKLILAIASKQPGAPDLEGHLDNQWVLRWLDDVGLPQYKDAFLEARVDGRVLNVLTVEDLFLLKVTNQLHHLSIRRGIQVLRDNRFEPNCLRRRALPGEAVTPHQVSLWSNHRVMEWLKQVDLAEYAPNLRGSGVHGGLLVHESRFNDSLLGLLLSIPSSKTLLRRHLSIHFKELVGRDVMGKKREAESSPSYAPLTPTAKATKAGGQGQFTLKRKKSKSSNIGFDHGELLCPFMAPLSPVPSQRGQVAK